MIEDLHKEVKRLQNKEKAIFLQRFFKTGKGQYAEGDIFYGLTVPQSRVVVKKYKDLSLKECAELLKSKIHEERLIALLILVSKFKKSDLDEKEKIYNLYLNSTKYINNWDLVDLSASRIVGRFLLENPKYVTTLQGETLQGTEVLRFLAKSENLWERRIAIISTFEFIYEGKYKKTLEIAKILLHDKHDLIHKAVGWMLREVGKRCSLEEEIKFLDKYASVMPRTMLRYAIEKFEPDLRKRFLKV